MIALPIIPNTQKSLIAQYVMFSEDGYRADYLYLPVLAWDAEGVALVAEVEVSSRGQLTRCGSFAAAMSSMTGDTWKFDILTTNRIC